MSVPAAPPIPLVRAAMVPRSLRRFSVAEYHKMIDSGILKPLNKLQWLFELGYWQQKKANG